MYDKNNVVQGVNMSENVVETIEANEYMSVSEFATRAGCSKQAVYQQLNKRLKPYVKAIDGKKAINSKALREIYGKEIQPEKQSVVKEVDQELNKDLIAFFKSQIEKKDQQIAEKNQEIEKLLRMLEREQAQVAIAQSQIQQLQDKQHQETVETKEEPKEDQQEKQEEPEKKSWIRRLFGI